MKILHFADIHIKDKCVNEYYKIFKTILFPKLRQIKQNNPNELIVVVIAGDLFHTKIKLTAEEYKQGYWFLENLASLFQTIIIPGNHDCNMNNSKKMDLIVPIADALKKSNNVSVATNLFYWNKTGVYTDRILFPNIKFHVWSCIDQKIPDIKNNIDVEYANIALVHHSVGSAIFQNGMKCDDNNYATISQLSNYHLTLLGDIHKHQYLKPYIAYPGSLIQQNVGEHPTEHGFIIWDIDNSPNKINIVKNSQFITVDNPLGNTVKFTIKNNKTIKNNDVKTVTKIKEFIIEHSGTELKYIDKLKNSIISRYPNAKCVQIKDISIYERVKMGGKYIDCTGNMSSPFDIENKENIKEWLECNKTPETDIDQVLEYYEELLILTAPDTDDSKYLKNIRPWKIKYMEWQGLCNYTYDSGINYLDFSTINGNLNALIGANKSGKSSVIDILVFLLFNRSFKSSCSDLINSNSNSKKYYCKICIKSGNNDYEIIRHGKGTKSIVELFRDGIVISKESIPSTYLFITKYIVGSYENFLNINLAYQGGPEFISYSSKKQMDYIYKVLKINRLLDMATKCRSANRNAKTQIKSMDQLIPEEALMNQIEPEVIQKHQELLETIDSILLSSEYKFILPARYTTDDFKNIKPNLTKPTFFTEENEELYLSMRAPSHCHIIEDDETEIKKTDDPYNKIRDLKLSRAQLNERLIVLRENLEETKNIIETFDIEQIGIDDLKIYNEQYLSKIEHQLDDVRKKKTNLQLLQDSNSLCIEHKNLSNQIDKITSQINVLKSSAETKIQAIKDNDNYEEMDVSDIKMTNEEVRNKIDRLLATVQTVKVFSSFKFAQECKCCQVNKKYIDRTRKGKVAMQFVKDLLVELGHYENMEYNLRILQIDKNLKEKTCKFKKFRNSKITERNQITNKINGQIKTYNAQIINFQAKLDLCQTIIVHRTNIINYNKYPQDIELLSKQIARINKQIESLKNAEHKLQGIINYRLIKITQYKNNLKLINLQNQYNAHINIISQLEETRKEATRYSEYVRIYKIQQRYKSKIKEKKELLQKCRIFGIMLNALDVKNGGFPSWVFDKACSRIQDVCNYWLNFITDFTIHFPPCDSKWAVRLKNGLSIQNGSGFQKFIVSILMRIAFMEITKSPTSILIIDEGFGSCDEYHLGKLMNMRSGLPEIAKGLNFILMISHQQLANASVQNTIIIDTPGYLRYGNEITERKKSPLHNTPTTEIKTKTNPHTNELITYFTDDSGIDRFWCNVCDRNRAGDIIKKNPRKYTTSSLSKHLETKTHIKKCRN
jgi:DNA repair exonuclease SbcCD nuclease subunit